MKSAIVGIAALACAFGVASAQETATPVAPIGATPVAPVTTPPVTTPPVATPPVATPLDAAVQPGPVVAPSGQVVGIVLTQQISSKTAKKGDRFTFKLSTAVVINGVEIIPAGTPGEGEVIDASHAGLAGKPGEIQLAARFLQLGDQKIPLRGMKLGSTGVDRTDTVLAATIFVGVVGVLISGGDITYPAGYPATAKLNQDVAARPAAPAPTSAAAG